MRRSKRVKEGGFNMNFSEILGSLKSDLSEKKKRFGTTSDC